MDQSTLKEFGGKIDIFIQLHTHFTSSSFVWKCCLHLCLQIFSRVSVCIISAKEYWSKKAPDKILRTFYEQLLRWYSFDKNYKVKLWFEKRFSKHFCTKKLLVKCSWNWHLGEVPRARMIRIAIRLCNPECSTQTANINPPTITKLVAFM